MRSEEDRWQARKLLRGAGELVMRLIAWLEQETSRPEEVFDMFV